MTPLLLVAFIVTNRQFLAACCSRRPKAELGSPVYFKQFEIQMNVEDKRMFFLAEEIQVSWILLSC